MFWPRSQEPSKLKEAVIANQIPQTATVKRKEAKLKVRYVGTPQFKPIEDTTLEYAINTSSEVIHAEGRYYAIEHGVWLSPIPRSVHVLSRK